LVNARFVKPLDTEMLDNIASKFDLIVTLEENQIQGGFGSAVLEYFAEKDYKNTIKLLGLPDKFIEHGTQEELHEELKLDSKGLTETIIEFINHKEKIY
jgi:1-deoxy-D-xylulose-5-phosphate synthase